MSNPKSLVAASSTSVPYMYYTKLHYTKLRYTIIMLVLAVILLYHHYSPITAPAVVAAAAPAAMQTNRVHCMYTRVCIDLATIRYQFVIQRFQL